jgi:hypothetical protein
VTDTGPSQAGDANLGITTFLNGTLVSNITIDTSEIATDTIDYVATDSDGLTGLTPAPEAEFYVTDFGGFEPPAGLCWALEGNWLKGGATGREKAAAVTPPRLRSVRCGARPSVQTRSAVIC